MEHRWGKRSTLDIGVGLHLGSGAVDAGCIANASLSGAFVRTTRRLPAFTRVVVEFEGGSSRQSAPRCAPAYVVRTAPEGLGLEWYEFAPPAVAALLGPIAARSRNAGARTAEALAREHPQLDLLVTD
jgi:PilZ domain